MAKKYQGKKFEKVETFADLTQAAEQTELDDGGITKDQYPAPPAEDVGYISESLLYWIDKCKKVRIQGKSLEGQDQIWELTISGKFFNAERILFNKPYGRRILVAIRGDDYRWRYGKDFVSLLEDPRTVEGVWVEKVHSYYALMH